MRKDLMSMSREYMKSPEKQYYKYLLKILEMGKKQGVSMEKIKKFVDDWIESSIIKR